LQNEHTTAVETLLASVPGTDVDQANNLIAIAVEGSELADTGVALGLDEYDSALP
jgi:hypothetical protein